MVEPIVRRGAQHRTDAGICAVVMSYKTQATTADAVRSLLRQEIASEIVVVNSGGPSLRPVLGSLGDRVLLVESPSRLLPGGARNLGIRHSAAPIVSFLAADCLAGDGWIAARMDAHRAGDAAVASALRPVPSGDRVPTAAMASYWALHWRRMPETPSAAASLYGVSYERALLERFGLFRDDLLVSEDSRFNALLRDSGAPISWHPKVVTYHRYPETPAAAYADMLKRGRRMARFHRTEMQRDIRRMTERGAAINARVVPSIEAWIGPERMRQHAAARRLLPRLLRTRMIGAAVGILV